VTIRLDMCKAVTNAREALGDSAEAVKGFFRRQLAPDGGFRGRDGRSDLYYTVFGLEASLMLGVDLPRDQVVAYLDSFGQGESFDLVHLAALIRCQANMDNVRDPEALAQRLTTYRSRDGGFNLIPGEAQGSAYGGFLALGAWQDLGLECRDVEAVAESIASLQRAEGGYANEASMTAAATPATAAAICVLYYLNRAVPESAIRWLLARVHPLGGFTAIPFLGDLGAPDLLSTATALHALGLIGVQTDDARDKHLDYLDSLWTSEGGFRGHSGDDVVDCEYTYYGLLALGTLTP